MGSEGVVGDGELRERRGAAGAGPAAAEQGAGEAGADEDDEDDAEAEARERKRHARRHGGAHRGGFSAPPSPGKRLASTSSLSVGAVRGRGEERRGAFPCGGGGGRLCADAMRTRRSALLIIAFAFALPPSRFPVASQPC